ASSRQRARTRVDLWTRGLYTRFCVVTRPAVAARDLLQRAARRKEMTYMRDDYELDTNELAKQLSYLAEDNARSNEESGMARRELLKRGGVGAAAVAGLGGLAGTAAAAPAKTGKFTGTLRVITLGVEFPTPEVAKRIKTELGFDVALTATDPVTEVQKAITAP